MTSLLTKYTSGIITIEDSLRCDGKNVLRYILNNNVENVVVISSENSPDKWKSFLQRKFICHYSSYSKRPSEIFSKVTGGLAQKSTIVIDSINQLSALWTWPSTVKFINDICVHVSVKCVIVMLHNDCLLYGVKMQKQLRHISQTYIVIDSKISPAKYLIDVKTVLPKGKVEQSKESFYFDNDGGKWKSEKVRVDNIRIPLDKPVTPHNISSFKIAVDNSAKVVKDDLVLPYTNLNSGGKVLYEYDATDDWDDEDPDDDLDI